MAFERKIRNDRSGVSTLLIAVIIIAAVVGTSVAAYVVLSGDGEGEETLAPGTWAKADITINGLTQQYEESFIGQNAAEYFVKSTTTVGSFSSVHYYLLLKTEAKGVPAGAVKIGEEERETIDGLKNLEIWEYSDTNGGAVTRAYLDPDIKWLVYEGESTLDNGETATYMLKDYNIAWQKTYKESKSIDKTHVYAFATGTSTYPAGIMCVADCQGGQYGVMYDFSYVFNGLIVFLLSDNIQGLPVDAVKTGMTEQLTGTIDGNVNTEIWAWGDEEWGILFFCAPSTHTIYCMILSVYNYSISDYVDYPFYLTSKPK